MADVHEPKVRSYNMSQIKGKDTKPELLVRKYLFAQGLRYRLHDKKLPGKPDLVFSKHKKVVQVHGCFWHRHSGCRYAHLPKTRTEWWRQKLESNIRRDVKQVLELEELGWETIVVWECELKKDKREETLKNLYQKIMAD